LRKRKVPKGKKGFTLIEILTAFSLIILILSFELISMSKYKENLNKYDLDYSMTSILQMINNSRVYCREKKTSGFILFDITSNNIRFYCKGSLIQIFKLSSKTKLVYMNAYESKINIDKYGITSNDCSITVRDEKGGNHIISMCVGTSYVQIKE
jgi:type II secretory pathway pseudopilin PulG